MKKLSPNKVSRYRQEVAHQCAELKELALKAGYGDLLFGATQIEVYRRCGKANCRCAKGGKERHGPYSYLHVRRGGRSHQIRIRSDEKHYLEMAQHYQYQRRNRRKLVLCQQKLLKLLDKMLEARTIWNK